MKNSVLLTLSALFILSGCADRAPAEPVETPACMKYRAMMTAPLPPDVHQRLRLECERSVQLPPETR